MPAKQIAVDTVAKLLKKLGSQHDIGQVYEYTYQDKTVVTVDSTKSGRLMIEVAPSAWAIKIAEFIWQYELDVDTTVDPTMADPTTAGWSAIMLTDAPEVDDAQDEDTEEVTSDDESLADDES